jgi:outer membrane protein OmpU
MKKLLMGATALAMVGATGAAAQEWNLDLGGFAIAGVGYVDGTSAQESDVAIVNNAEIIFNFSLVADNGLTFGFKAEMEANGQSNNADEYVAFISGSFGRLEVGAEDGAHDRLRTFAAGGTTFTSAADEAGFLFDYSTSVSPARAFGNVGADTGDALKVTYFTPRVAGFQAGVSYANGLEGPISNNAALLTDDLEAFELGANYRNTFGEFSVELGGGYTGYLNQSVGTDNAYSIGGKVGFAGFSFGAMYGYTDNTGGITDVEGFAVGAGYATGPWAFGLQYAQTTRGNGVNQFGAEDGDYGISAGVDYALAPGVKVGAVVEYADADDSSVGDAWAFGVLTRFDF